MNRSKGLMVLAGAAFGLATSGAALANEPVGSDEVRAIVAEMLSDAQGRTSLLQAGATGGHDGRFFVASPDGAFRLNVGGQIQFRYILNWRDDDDDPQRDALVNGFEARRTKLDLTGNIVNKDWTFRVLSAFDRNGGGGILEEAWVQYNFGTGWKARWGQFKLPLLREELVSSARQLAADRSVVNELFTQDRSQGIELMYEQEDWNLRLAFSDGLDSENTPWNDLSLVNNTAFRVMGQADYAFTGRFEYKFAGTWARFADFTSRQGDDFAGMFGVAAHFQESPNTPAATDVDRRTIQYTADVSFEGDGWNLFGAFVGRNDRFSGAGTRTTLNDFGGVVQGGYRFAPNTELFARWDALFPDTDRVVATTAANPRHDWYNFLTFGLNQYYAGHAAKATIDVVWALEQTDEIVEFLGTNSAAGLGLLGSPDRNEIVLRLQFQLLF